jgi:hypothetical protein
MSTLRWNTVSDTENQRWSGTFSTVQVNESPVLDAVAVPVDEGYTAIFAWRLLSVGWSVIHGLMSVAAPVARRLRTVFSLEKLKSQSEIYIQN